MNRSSAAICFIILASNGAFAQSAKFEAADVHVSPPATNPYTFVSGGELRGERYDIRKATMLDLIRIGYGVDPDRVIGGPSWLELDRFDISAKAPASTSPETVKLMLQALLADRFKLVVHKDTRPLPAFALRAGKGRPKLKDASGVGEPACQSVPQPNPAPSSAMACRNMTMAAFAQTLRGIAGDYLTYRVVDSTGLEGSWDFDFRWNSRSQVLPGGAARTTIFNAMDQQLGLSLDLSTFPEPVLVVDRVNEKPSENPPGVAKLLPPRLTEFDVADLKPSRPDEMPFFRLYPNGRFEMLGFPLRILISTAWDVDWDHIDEVLIGAPKWIATRQFDIVAKTTAATESPSGTGFIDDDARLMIRALLIDRFQMKVHHENRPIPAYSLVAVKPKLKKADPANRSSCKQAQIVANDPRDADPRLSQLLDCRNMTMAQFATRLQGIAPDYFAHPVEDATHMEGAFDFTVNFTPRWMLGSPGDPVQAAAGAASDPNGAISIFDAVSKQPRLKAGAAQAHAAGHRDRSHGRQAHGQLIWGRPVKTFFAPQ